MPAKKTHESFLDDIHKRNIIKEDNEQISLLEHERYQTLDTPLKFRCSNNHTFETKPRYIIQKKSGCPICSSKRVGINNIKSHNTFLEELKQRNEDHHYNISLKDGETYQGTYTQLTFVCEQGHEFQTLPKTIIRGSGCPVCAPKIKAQQQTHTPEQFKLLLDQRNSKNATKVFLKNENDYIKQDVQTKFVCEEDHQWFARPGDIIHRNSGCPHCAVAKSFSYKAIQWLKHISNDEGIYIRHHGNVGEYNIPGTRYKADGYCEETNTIYEFYGNFWHGNPRLFDYKTINKITGKSFGQLYEETIQRENKIKSLGYNLTTIWEDQYCTLIKNKPLQKKFMRLQNLASSIVELVYLPITQPCDKYYCVNQIELLRTNKKEGIFVFEDEWEKNHKLIESKIKHYTNQNTSTKIHGRQCQIKIIDKNKKRDFLNDHHIQGNDAGQINYGAFHGSNLVAVMTFCAPRVALGYKNKDRTKYKNVWELSRFATHSEYRIPGIASKLLSYFRKNHKWTEIFSFADRRWSVGNLYYKLGFELTRTNPPDYFYIIDGQRKHRWNFRKDIIKNTLPNYDSELTEYQNMQNHGFWRVWDAGTLRFSMRN